MLLLGSLLLATSSRAQDAAVVGASDTHYDALTEQGLEAFSAGRVDEARDLFERAHALVPSARTLRALGITALAMDRYGQAWIELRGALEHPNRSLTKAQRVEVQELLEWMRTSLGSVRVDAQPSHARTKVDGQPLDAPETRLKPGEHSLEVVADGFEPHSERFRLDVGDQLTLRVRLGAKPIAAAAPEESRSPRLAVLRPNALDEPRAPSDPSASPEADHGTHAGAPSWPWWVGGGGLALIAAGGTLLALGVDDVATVESTEKVRWSEIESAQGRAPWLIGSGITLGVVGLGGLTVAAVALWTDRERDRGGFAWSVGPGELSIRQQF